MYESDLKLFQFLEHRVATQYSKFNLTHLLNWKYGKENSLQFFSNTMRKKKPIKLFHDFNFYDDLDSITKDIQYMIALISIYKDELNNPLKEKMTYNQNLFDRRYLMYASIIFEKYYNYWDRLGDLLSYYFDTKLNEKRIYFSSVIEHFPLAYKSSKYFKWLNSFYLHEYKVFNNKRINIVHSSQLDSYHFSGFLNNHNDRKKVKELYIEKKSYFQFFVDFFKSSKNGFINTVLLINQLPDK